MPNWCFNQLTVSGAHEELDRFLDASIGLPAIYSGTEDDPEHLEPQFCFNALVPTPPEVLEIGFDGHGKIPPIDLEKFYRGTYSGPLDGYHWNCLNWGTKWDVYGDGITSESIIWSENENGSDSITFGFDTAWSPPVGWFQAAVEQFPSLDFAMHYEEPGCYFAGVLYGKEGKCKDEPYDDEALKKLFGYE